MSPEAIAFVNQALVPIGLALIMFSMGLTLALRDFAAILSGGRAAVAGLATHLLVLPLLGLGVGALFGLSPELALGLFVISICPAGTTSNALTFVGRGNLALAVVLTLMTSVVTVFTIPLLLRWAVPWFLGGGSGGGGGAVPRLHIVSTMGQLARITLAPIAAGMVVRRFAPGAAAVMAQRLRPTALVVLVAVIGFSVIVSFDMVVANLIAATPAIYALNAAAMAFGLLVGRVLGLNQRDRMTLAIETGVQNATLALFLTLTVLGSLPLAVTQNIYGVVMLMNATLLIRWFKGRIAREEAQA